MATRVTSDDLIKRTWRFFHKSGPIASDAFRFLADGAVAGYDHPDQRFWRIDDGIVILIGEDGMATVRFDTVLQTDDGLLLSGSYLPNPQFVLCLSELPRRLPGTRLNLANEIHTLGWEIGEHTYGVPAFEELGRAKLIIGRYCSIANGVKISFADHRLDLVSTYPFVSFRNYWPSVPEDASDHRSKGDVRIGNDVWIGADVFIGSGVSVGDGAVIGARSVVTRNVPPYALVVGSPARVVRYRFPEPVMTALLRIRWWDWPDDVVSEHLPLMMSGDIDAFLARAEPRHEVPAAADACR